MSPLYRILLAQNMAEYTVRAVWDTCFAAPAWRPGSAPLVLYDGLRVIGIIRVCPRLWSFEARSDAILQSSTWVGTGIKIPNSTIPLKHLLEFEAFPWLDISVAHVKSLRCRSIAEPMYLWAQATTCLTEWARPRYLSSTSNVFRSNVCGRGFPERLYNLRLRFYL